MNRSFPNKVKSIAWRKRIIWRKQRFPSKSKSLAPCPTECNAEVSKKIFCYLPKDRIRLIKLHPGSLNDSIKCDIQEATFSDPPPSYHALSYVWGSSENAEYIDLNSESFCVTKNLAEALRRLRQADRTLIMWIDALCINQTDHKEKSTQVPLMGLVYERARTVIAFLGEHDETSPVLFKFLKNLEGTVDIGRALEALDRDELFTIIPALHTFWRREYWQRAWIVQELILNQNKWIQCESDIVSFLTMENAQKSLLSSFSVDISPTDPSPTHGVGYPVEWPPRFQQLCSLRRALTTDDFFRGFLDARCSNPRDHIYAFYSLLPDIQKHTEVNYDKKPEEVICQAVKSIIMETQSLHIITLRGRQVRPQEECMKWQYAMPSWCPFFGVSYMSDPLPRHATNFYGTEGIAAFSIDGRLLHVKGVVFAMICEAGPQRSTNNLPFENVDFNKDKLRFHHELMYAHKCAEFIEARAGDDSDLNGTVLADIVPGDNEDGENGLLRCLEKRSELDPIRKEGLNRFARFFHTRKLCIFRYDDSFIDISNLSSYKDIASDKILSDFAIIPGRACSNDILCAIVGTEHPIVLRQQGEHYEVLGEAKIFSRTCDDILTYVGTSKYRDFTLA